HLEHLRAIGGEGVLAGQVFLIGVAGQETLREADDFDAIAVGTLQALDDLGEVALEIAAFRLELAMTDAHVKFLGGGRAGGDYARRRWKWHSDRLAASLRRARGPRSPEARG